MGARDELERPAPAIDAAREYAFTRADFERVRRMIHVRAGISLNESKENMVYSRLSRRLRALGLASFGAYLDRIEKASDRDGGEAEEFVNALTTNLTAFFREPHHFPVLAEFLRAQRDANAVRIWCCAASTGEEPYSIAITIAETLAAGARLLATDIDTRVLATAERGVYPLEAARACGDERLKRFFLRGAGANEGMVRVKPELAQRVEFAPLNLLADDWPALRSFAPAVDAIFCRNVMIYFDRPTQHRIVERFAQVLRPRGLLFVGHSENFSEQRRHFALRGQTVYERL
jgi:chemotaxis protein methyltransferase CheR